MNIHDKNFQQNSKKAVIASYLEFIDELNNELDLNHPFLDEYFSETLTSIFKKDSDLKNYSEKKIFWLGQVEALIFLLGLCEEYEEADSVNEKQELEEDFFNFWDATEYSKLFLGYLKEEKNIWDATQELIPVLENQILAIYYIQINPDASNPENKSLLYSIIPEMGDSHSQLYLGNQHRLLTFDGSKVKTFPSLVIDKIPEDKKSLKINNVHYDLKDEFANKIDGEDVFFLPNCEEGFKSYDTLISNLGRALKIIKDHSPLCYQAFQNFTKCVIPVNEKAIVSYSMQSLPGYSSINMFNRDFVDLIDDLVHENGHHYLNTILNSQELLNEDDDKIYYSPWRRSLRAVRGIYHAVFTFYWGLELFSNLFEKRENLSLDENEINKIAFRVAEEFTMINACKESLEHAYDNSKITEDGMNLIESILQKVELHTDIFNASVSHLKKEAPKYYKSYQDLNDTIQKKLEQYKLS